MRLPPELMIAKNFISPVVFKMNNKETETTTMGNNKETETTTMGNVLIFLVEFK